MCHFESFAQLGFRLDLPAGAGALCPNFRQNDSIVCLGRAAKSPITGLPIIPTLIRVIALSEDYATLSSV